MAPARSMIEPEPPPSRLSANQPWPCLPYGFRSASSVPGTMPSSVAVGWPSSGGKDSVIDIGIAPLRYMLFDPVEGFQVFASQSGT